MPRPIQEIDADLAECNQMRTTTDDELRACRVVILETEARIARAKHRREILEARIDRLTSEARDTSG
jgi:hypothetical protein